MTPSSLKIIDLPYYSEGPATDSMGNFYCTTLTGGSILKIDQYGNWLEWAKSDCPNGQVTDANDHHFICDSKLAAVIRYDNEGKFSCYEINGSCGGHKVFVPNDLVLSENGGLYFTDSIRAVGKLFYKSAAGTARVLATGLDYPNGLVLSPDRRSLYVAESYLNRIVILALNEDGTAAGHPTAFASLPYNTNASGYNLPDGMAMDHKGNLWIAHYGMSALQVLSPAGQLLYTVSLPFPLVSNVHIISHHPFRIIVTGGHGEPGPGAFAILSFNDY